MALVRNRNNLLRPLRLGDAIQDAPRHALAIEPMTYASDALNHPEWDLTRLSPGEAFSGVYHIAASGIERL